MIDKWWIQDQIGDHIGGPGYLPAFTSKTRVVRSVVEPIASHILRTLNKEFKDDRVSDQGTGS